MLARQRPALSWRVPGMISILTGDFGAWARDLAGIAREPALELLSASSSKSNFPEPLRVAHLLAAALVRGESRGRV